jgi:excisionase family DNA binding protein
MWGHRACAFFPLEVLRPPLTSSEGLVRGKMPPMEEESTDSGVLSGMPSGSDRASDRQEVYTVAEAAKVLDITERRVRQLAQDGKIEGVREEAGWKVFRYSVHDFRDRRRESQKTLSEPRETASEAREWIERVTERTCRDSSGV